MLWCVAAVTLCFSRFHWPWRAAALWQRCTAMTGVAPRRVQGASGTRSLDASIHLNNLVLQRLSAVHDEARQVLKYTFPGIRAFCQSRAPPTRRCLCTG